MPTFIRGLAFWVFVVGGSASAAIAWLYKVRVQCSRLCVPALADLSGFRQSIIYPRLVLALRARTQLHSAHLETYTRFLSNLRLFADSKGYRLFVQATPTHAAALSKGGPTEQSSIPATVAQAEANDAAESSSLGTGPDCKDADGASPTVVEGLAPFAPPPPPLMEPIRSALQTLHTSARPSESTITGAASQPARSLDDGSSADRLRASLDGLTQYLDKETAATIASGYRSYGAPVSSGSSEERKTLQSTISNLKADIRSVKGALPRRARLSALQLMYVLNFDLTGALLNRRNFATLAPRDSPVVLGA